MKLNRFHNNKSKYNSVYMVKLLLRGGGGGCDKWKVKSTYTTNKNPTVKNLINNMKSFSVDSRIVVLAYRKE